MIRSPSILIMITSWNDIFYPVWTLYFGPFSINYLNKNPFKIQTVNRYRKFKNNAIIIRPFFREVKNRHFERFWDNTKFELCFTMPLKCLSFNVLSTLVFEIFLVFYIFCEVMNKFDDVIAITKLDFKLSMQILI